MIYITGDTHGKFGRVEVFCQKMKTTKDDTLIILGDAGFNFYGNWSDEYRKKLINDCPIRVFCIHGNHEIRPQNIPTYVEGTFCGGKVLYEPDYPDILFGIDGEVYDFDGLSSIVIGGAYSVDKFYRLSRGYGWWRDEQPSDEIKAKVEATLAERGNKIDVILSHTTPLKYEPVEVFLSFIDQSTVDKSTEEWLDKLEEKVEYKKWYSAHYHTMKKIDRLQIMYEDFDILTANTDSTTGGTAHE